MCEDIVHGGDLIFELDGTEVVVCSLGEVTTAMSGAAIIRVEDCETVAGEEAVEDPGSYAAVSDVCGPGPP